MSDQESRTRDAIDRTAARWREVNAKGGVQMTHEEARDRVRKARELGDRRREER